MLQARAAREEKLALSDAADVGAAAQRQRKILVDKSVSGRRPVHGSPAKHPRPDGAEHVAEQPGDGDDTRGSGAACAQRPGQVWRCLV